MLTMAFGISSLVFSIVAIFVPVFGVFIAGVSGILAWLSVGRAVFPGLAAVMINVFNILLYSPSFLALISIEASQRTPDQSRVLNVWMIVLAIQVIAVFLFIFNSILHSLYKSDPSPKKPDRTVPEDGESNRFRDHDFPLPLAEERGRGPKRFRTVRSPMIAVSFICILVLIGWAGFNLYDNGFKHVPLNRVYKGVPGKSDQAEETGPPALRSRAEGIYEPETDDEVRRKTLPGPDEKIYSWNDKSGRKQFSNVNPPQNGQEVRHHPELIDDRERTAVEIADNKIFIPITIIHNSKKLETSLQVNSSFSRSVLPARIADFLQAELLSAQSVKTIDGGEIILEKRKVDLFKAGPHIEHDFLIVTQEGKGGVTRGILGQDFLAKHPYSIDYENQAIIWE